MDELLNRIAGAAEISTETARQAVGHILAYMVEESDDPAVGEMIRQTPGAAETIPAGANAGGGIMALGAKLMGLGLDMGQIRTVAEELVAGAEASAGDDLVRRAIASVPSLSQFV